MQTNQAAMRQLQAMEADLYEVGIFDQSNSSMWNRVWDIQAIDHSIPWLRYRNSTGSHIYVRPSGEHKLSLVDDLSVRSVTEMMRTGFQPSVVVETSPHNYQAWVNHGRVLDKEHSTAAAKSLARRFGADIKAADWRHYGRLGGFANRKDKHVDVLTGHYPFVKVHIAKPVVYDRADEFMKLVVAEVRDRQAEAQRNQELWKLRNANRLHQPALKSIETFRHDPRYGYDLHRADAAFATYALSHGMSKDAVAAAIASRDLTKKGNERQQEAYINRTIARALAGRGR
jgi:hypothetical protein